MKRLFFLAVLTGFFAPFVFAQENGGKSDSKDAALIAEARACEERQAGRRFDF